MYSSAFSRLHFKNDEIKADRWERSAQVEKRSGRIGGNFENRRERSEVEKGAIATGEK
jgi:hypothetical protein